jgi:hypothetical protein
MQRRLVGRENICNLLLCFIYWNMSCQWQTLSAWMNNFLHFWRLKRCPRCVGMIPPNGVHDVVLANTKHVIQKGKFFSLNCVASFYPQSNNLPKDPITPPNPIKRLQHKTKNCDECVMNLLEVKQTLSSWIPQSKFPNTIHHFGCNTFCHW